MLYDNDGYDDDDDDADKYDDNDDDHDDDNDDDGGDGEDDDLFARSIDGRYYRFKLVAHSLLPFGVVSHRHAAANPNTRCK